MPLQSAVMQQFIIWESYVFLIKQLPQIKCKYIFAASTCKKTANLPQITQRINGLLA